MQQRKRLIIGAAVLAGVIALGGAGAAVAGGSGSDDATERPINGAVRQQAEAAALQHTAGGKVTGTEEGDEESLYEVEVTRADGSAVDVQLDKDFKVVGDKVDNDTTEGR